MYPNGPHGPEGPMQPDMAQFVHHDMWWSGPAQPATAPAARDPRRRHRLGGAAAECAAHPRPRGGGGAGGLAAGASAPRPRPGGTARPLRSRRHRSHRVPGARHGPGHRRRRIRRARAAPGVAARPTGVSVTGSSTATGPDANAPGPVGVRVLVVDDEAEHHRPRRHRAALRGVRGSDGRRRPDALPSRPSSRSGPTSWCST